MRISDWSSDVCSSDLLSLSLDYFDIKVSNGVADLDAGTILNRCYGDANFNPNEGFCRFVERDENNALTVTSSFVNLSEDIRKGFEFNGRYARDLRSEEHTSELQSLMRISYAVFCWKKKQSKTIKKHNSQMKE